MNLSLLEKKSDVFYTAINSNKNRIMVVVYHGFSSMSHLQSIARDEETITKSIRVGDLMGGKVGEVGLSMTQLLIAFLMICPTEFG